MRTFDVYYDTTKIGVFEMNEKNQKYTPFLEEIDSLEKNNNIKLMNMFKVVEENEKIKFFDLLIKNCERFEGAAICSNIHNIELVEKTGMN